MIFDLKDGPFFYKDYLAFSNHVHNHFSFSTIKSCNHFYFLLVQTEDIKQVYKKLP